MFYQFQIDELPSQSNLVLVDLPLVSFEFSFCSSSKLIFLKTRTNFFVGNLDQQAAKHRFLNVSLSLIANGMIRQQQSILIDNILLEFTNRSALKSLSFSLTFVIFIRLLINLRI